MKKSKLILLAFMLPQISIATDAPIVFTRGSTDISGDVQKVLGVMGRLKIMGGLERDPRQLSYRFMFPADKSVPVQYEQKPYLITAMNLETYQTGSCQTDDSGRTESWEGMRYAADVGGLKDMLKERLPFALGLPAKLEVTVDSQNISAFTFSFHATPTSSSSPMRYGDCNLIFYAKPEITLSQGTMDFFNSF